MLINCSTLRWTGKRHGCGRWQRKCNSATVIVQLYSCLSPRSTLLRPVCVATFPGCRPNSAGQATARSAPLHGTVSPLQPALTDTMHGKTHSMGMGSERAAEHQQLSNKKAQAQEALQRAERMVEVWADAYQLDQLAALLHSLLSAPGRALNPSSSAQVLKEKVQHAEEIAEWRMRKLERQVRTDPRSSTAARRDFRSALYNWPTKIEHWPPDLRRSNMYLTTRPYFVLCLVLPVKKPLESAGQCSILAGQL